MVLVIIVAAMVLLLIVSEYKEWKDRISLEELPKVIKEMIDNNEKINVLEQGIIYSPEEKEFIVKGLEIAWAYEGAKSYRKLLIKYRELEKVINKKRFERMLDILREKSLVKKEVKESLTNKINIFRKDYPEVYFKCFKDYREVNEYIERLMKDV